MNPATKAYAALGILFLAIVGVLIISYLLEAVHKEDAQALENKSYEAGYRDAVDYMSLQMVKASESTQGGYHIELGNDTAECYVIGSPLQKELKSYFDRCAQAMGPPQ